MVTEQEATNVKHNNCNPVNNTRSSTLFRYAFGIMIAVLSINANAENTMHYYDAGNRQRTIQLQPGLVAEFAGKTQTQARSAKSSSQKPFVTIKKNTTRASRAPASASNQSPVFREGDSPAGRLMALPGGVIVNFKLEWTDEQVRLWAAEHDHAIKQKLNILGNWYIIDTPPGLAALETANKIQQSGEVLSASPNWWKQTSTR